MESSKCKAIPGHAEHMTLVQSFHAMMPRQSSRLDHGGPSRTVLPRVNPASQVIKIGRLDDIESGRAQLENSVLAKVLSLRSSYTGSGLRIALRVRSCLQASHTKRMLQDESSPCEW